MIGKYSLNKCPVEGHEKFKTLLICINEEC
jgi:hypothetical protein